MCFTWFDKREMNALESDKNPRNTNIEMSVFGSDIKDKHYVYTLDCHSAKNMSMMGGCATDNFSQVACHCKIFLKCCKRLYSSTY